MKKDNFYYLSIVITFGYFSNRSFSEFDCRNVTISILKSE